MKDYIKQKDHMAKESGQIIRPEASHPKKTKENSRYRPRGPSAPPQDRLAIPSSRLSSSVSTCKKRNAAHQNLGWRSESPLFRSLSHKVYRPSPPPPVNSCPLSSHHRQFERLILEASARAWDPEFRMKDRAALRYATTSAFSALLLATAAPAWALDSSSTRQCDPEARAHSAAPKTRIYGGEIAKTCEFPTTVGGTLRCTGTLVHPRVVISANHCREHKEIFFGEYRTKPSFKVKTRWCARRADADAQICVLEKAIEGLPVAPIIQGCEVDKIKVGAKVLISGYGLDENDPASGDDKYKDEKRWVETDIVRVTANDLHIGSSKAGACNGDSGGPAYLQMEDGTWRTLGATFRGAGGESHPNCNVGVWKRSDVLLRWFEEQLRKHNETDIDLSPCFDDQGKWAPNKNCGGFAKDVRGPYGSWDNNCGKGSPVVKYSATCGDPYKPEGGDTQTEVMITRPKDGSVFKIGQEIRVEAEISPDDDLAKVELLVDDKVADSKEVGDKSSAPYRFEIEELKAGAYELQVNATAKDGSQSKSKAISIKVNAKGDSGSDDEEDDSTKPGESGNTSGDKNKKPGSGDAKGKSKGKSSPNGDDSDEDDSSEDDNGADKTPKKGGCSLSDPSGPSFLWLLGLIGFIRRRPQPSRNR